jgi:epoxyqueuosine reductase
MYHELQREVEKNGDRVRLLPMHRLENIRKDIIHLKTTETLSDFILDYVTNDYDLRVPEADFDIRSVGIIASPCPAAAVVTFNWKGRKIPVRIPASYFDYVARPAAIKMYLQEFLSPKGYHVHSAPNLPRKMLAARSGLGAYGRNNILYVEGMGSFLNLAPFFTDIPCENDSWQDVLRMDTCESCSICKDLCPTGAIPEDRFLLYADRCLTYFNEKTDMESFPAWIPASAHNSMYGCMKCQEQCPLNREFIHNTCEPEEFTEEETRMIMEGRTIETLPEALAQRLRALEMECYLPALPRNLQVLFDTTE